MNLDEITDYLRTQKRKRTMMPKSGLFVICDTCGATHIEVYGDSDTIERVEARILTKHKWQMVTYTQALTEHGPGSYRFQRWRCSQHHETDIPTV